MSKGKKSSRRSGAKSAGPERTAGKKGGSCAGGQLSAGSLSVPGDLPPAFLSRMRTDLEDSQISFEQFYRSYERAPVHALTPNTMRGASVDTLPFVLSDDKIPWNSEAAVYEETPDNRPGKHALHEAGACYIQEASAMLPVRMLLDAAGSAISGAGEGGENLENLAFPDAEFSPECFDGLRVLDLCAAPGGKSTQLAMAMQGHGLLISNEIHPARAEILSRNMERMGVRNAVVTQTAPAQLRACLPSCFDLILVDAPCSGEGMFRRNPEAIREWSPEATELCAQRQREILDAAADMLRPGGVMVYSTCTFAPAEDEEQTRSFLGSHPDFVPEREVKLLPDCVLKPETGSQTGHWEGHYAAAFRYCPNGQLHASAGTCRSDPVSAPSAGTGQSGPVPLPPALFDRPDPVMQKKFGAWLHTLIADPAVIGFDPARLILFGSSLFLMPQLTPALPGIHVLRPGLKLAEIKKAGTDIGFVPAHALSHALIPADAACSVSLTYPQAAAYLNGQTIAVGDVSPLSELSNRPENTDLYSAASANLKADQADNESRYVLMTCGGFSLGWARRSGSTFKNLYPKGLRITL